MIYAHTVDLPIWDKKGVVNLNNIKTNSFNGLNRLPEIAEGEGAVFKGLSLKSYPAAESEGIRRTGAVYISLDGVDIAIDGGKLQAVGDIVLRDGKFYLTGVYEGVFYYEGAAVEYYGEYGEDRKLGASDRVEIVKAGKQYIILGVHPNGRSAIWVYNTVGSSEGVEDDKAADGKLKSEVIAYQLPPAPFGALYLYKITKAGSDGGPDDATKAALLQKATNKEYYMVYFFKRYAYSKVNRNCRSAMEGMQIYNQYYGMRGSTLALKPSSENLNPEKYCFDDSDSEHPVRFVIDAASLGMDNGGDIDVFDYLMNFEGQIYDVQSSITNRVVDFLDPYSMSKSSDLSYVPIFNSDGTLKSYENKPRTEGSGIIGHFEKWNPEKKRYEFYNSGEAPIYQLVDEEGNVAYPPGANDGTTSYYRTSSTVFESHTVIGLDYAGIINDSLTLSHITQIGNRTFATVKGGGQILYSASGKFTNFAEVLGAGSDSGFFSDSTEGEFTGLSEYSGTLLAFKENRISVYYGTPPNMTRSRDITGVGCIDCRSIKEVRGVLYFLAKDGFYAYSGGMPKRISRKLSRKYVSATAFEREGCYVANAVCEDGEMEILTYNPELDMWTENDGVSILAEDDGKLISEDGAVFEYCDSGSWCYETGDIFEGIFEEKGINEIYIRGRINGSFKVTTVSDDEEFEHSEITDDTMRLKVWRIPVRLKHKNHYRIRVEGVGRCVLYALERSSYIGGKRR